MGRSAGLSECERVAAKRRWWGCVGQRREQMAIRRSPWGCRLGNQKKAKKQEGWDWAKGTGIGLGSMLVGAVFSLECPS